MPQRLTLTQMRLKRHLSMGELAREAQVAQSTIFEIEQVSKTKRPRMSTIRKLSAALGCAPEDIEWPGNPLDAEPPFEWRFAPPSVQTAAAALVFAIQNYKDDRVGAAERELVRTMAGVGYPESAIQRAIDTAHDIAEP